MACMNINHPSILGLVKCEVCYMFNMHVCVLKRIKHNVGRNIDKHHHERGRTQINTHTHTHTHTHNATHSVSPCLQYEPFYAYSSLQIDRGSYSHDHVILYSSLSYPVNHPLEVTIKGCGHVWMCLLHKLNNVH